MLPKPSSPRALANRFAGSTVSTRTLPPWRTATIAATAAAVVVLPTPPEPQKTATSLAASSCSERARWSSSVAAASVPELRAEGLGDQAGRAQAVGLGEQLRHEEHRQRSPAATRGGARGGRPGSAAASLRAGRRRGSAPRPVRRRPANAARASSASSASKTSSSPRPNSSGSTRFTITAASDTFVSVLEAAGQLDGLVDGHLLGGRDDADAGAARVREDVDHPAGLLADQADADELVDGLGRRQLADDVTGRGRVDDDAGRSCAGRTSHEELADGEHLAHARARRWPRSRRRGRAGPSAPSAGASAGGPGTP